MVNQEYIYIHIYVYPIFFCSGGLEVVVKDKLVMLNDGIFCNVELIAPPIFVTAILISSSGFLFLFFTSV